MIQAAYIILGIAAFLFFVSAIAYFYTRDIRQVRKDLQFIEGLLEEENEYLDQEVEDKYTDKSQKRKRKSSGNHIETEYLKAKSKDDMSGNDKFQEEDGPFSEGLDGETLSTYKNAGFEAASAENETTFLDNDVIYEDDEDELLSDDNEKTSFLDEPETEEYKTTFLDGEENEKDSETTFLNETDELEEELDHDHFSDDEEEETKTTFLSVEGDETVENDEENVKDKEEEECKTTFLEVATSENSETFPFDDVENDDDEDVEYDTSNEKEDNATTFLSDDPKDEEEDIEQPKLENIEENEVLVRDEDKKLVLEKMTTVSESEFISDFTKTLDNKSMAEILPLIVNSGDMTADSMPI